jgi:GTP 3',8-cyclase
MIRIPHLETNVTVACQLSCRSCNHYVPMQRAAAKQSMATPKQMEQDLYWLHRAGLVADAYGMLGGEPTLHPNLVDLLWVAKKSEISPVIEVWTNGLSLNRQPTEFWTQGLVDILVLSAYPGTLDDEAIALIRGMCDEHGVRLRVNDERRVPNFEQLIEPEPTLPEETRVKYQACFFRQFSRVVDNGYFYRCCTTPFIPKLLLGQLEGTDGIRVEAITEEMLQAFLSQKDPALSCTRCVGLNPGNRRRQTWAQVRDPHEWERQSSRSGI